MVYFKPVHYSHFQTSLSLHIALPTALPYTFPYHMNPLPHLSPLPLTYSCFLTPPLPSPTISNSPPLPSSLHSLLCYPPSLHSIPTLYPPMHISSLLPVLIPYSSPPLILSSTYFHPTPALLTLSP